MTCSAKQTSPKQISPKLLIQVTAALILTLWLTSQTLAAPETTLTTVDGSGGDSVGAYSSLALNSSGYPVISYYDATNGDLKLAVCNNAACTKPTLTTVDDGDGDNVGFDTSLALNSSGFPVISYFDATNGDLKLAVCNNAACTKPTLTTVDDGGGDSVGGFSSLALNSSGFPVISYTDFSNGDLKLAVCKNATCSTTIQPPTFTTITTVDDGGGDAVGAYSSLALNSSGFPVISYFDVTNGDLKLAVCNNAACTKRTLTTVDDGGGDTVGWDTSLALNSSGYPVISYYDATNHDLKLAVCTNAACTNPTLTTVDGGGGDYVGPYTSLALDSSGYPVISYYDYTNHDLKLAVCPICTMPARTTVDSSGNVGRYTALALNSSAYPVIGYRDLTNVSLKLASCSNLNCSNHTLTTVDNTANVGNHASLVLNSSGHPLISYRDGTNQTLKLAICHDATCTNSPTLRTVDNTANVGAHTSLALNSSGHAVISYYDEANGALKLAVCNDPTCTNPTLTPVDNVGNVGGHTSLALNSSGYPIISYYDFDNEVLKLAVCHDATCTTSPTIRTVDNTASVGTYSSLALNSSGYPVISYFDDTHDDLKLALCNVETCTAPTRTTVDSVGDVGRHISMALSSSNLALISYYDATNDDLKLAVCRDSACTEATFTRVDGAGDVGRFTALVLDNSSFPVISYWDVSNEDLRLASYSTGANTSPPGEGKVYLPLVIK